MTHNEISGIIVDAAMGIHRQLGPGLLESVYQAVMAHELGKRGLRVQEQVPIPLEWEGVRLEVGFRADLIVEEAVIVELKSVDAVQPVHKKQLLTYLRVADKRLGLLINFGQGLLKDGICRVVNGLEDRHHAESRRRRERHEACFSSYLCASASLREDHLTNG